MLKQACKGLPTNGAIINSVVAQAQNRFQTKVAVILQRKVRIQRKKLPLREPVVQIRWAETTVQQRD